MKKAPPAQVEDHSDEIAALVRQLHETQERLEELVGSESETVLHPEGRSYLLHKAQEKLRESEAAQRALAASQASTLNALPAHIALVDREGVIISVNDGWRQFAKANALLSPNFGIGQNYLELCEQARDNGAEEAGQVAVGIRNVLSGAEPEFIMEYSCHAPAEQRWFRLMVSAIEQGETAGAVVMHVNITDRKLAEEASQLQAHMLDHIGQAVIAINTEGKVIYANRHASELYGWSVSEMLGNDILDLTAPQASMEQGRDIMARLVRGENWNGEFLVKNRTGRIFPVLISNSPLINDKGKLTGIIGVSTDISEQKRAEALLRESDQKFNQLVDNIHDAFWFRSPDLSEVQYISPAFERIWGRPVETLYNNPDKWISYIHPADRDRVKAAFAELTEEAPNLKLEYRILRPDGEVRWVYVRGFQIRDATGKIARHAGIVTDITDRKLNEIALEQAERLARESEERLNFALGAAEIGNWSRDLRTNSSHHSLRYFQCFGYGEAIPDWGYDTFLAHVHPEDREHVDACYQKGKSGSGEYSDEFRATWPDGSVHWLWMRGRFHFDQAGEPSGVAGIVTDISERKEAEEKLVASEASLAKAQAMAHLGSWDLDIATMTGVYSAEMFRLLYRDPSRGAIHFKDFIEVVHPLDRQAVREALKGAADEAEPYTIEFRTDPVLGPVRHISLTIQVTRDANGVPVRSSGTAQDITERRMVESEIRFNELRFRSLVEATSAIVWNMPASGQFEAEQPSWGAFTGQILEEYRGWGWLDAVHPDDQQETARVWLAAVASQSVFYVEHRLRTQGRVYRDMVVRAVPILGDDGEIRQWIGIHTDITERKRATERVAEQAALLDKANDAILVRGLDNRISYWNKGAERMFGWTAEEAMNRSIRNLVYTDPEPFDNAMRLLLERGDWHGELALISKDSRQLIVETSWTLMRDQAGQPHSVLVINTDIKERKRVNEALRKSEREQRELIRQLESERSRLVAAQTVARVGSWETNLKTFKVEWSAETFRIFGAHPNANQPSHSGFLEYVHPEDREAVDIAFAESITRHEQSSSVEHRVLRPDGRVTFVEERWQVFHDEMDQPARAVGTCQDITERKEAEKALKHVLERLHEAQRVGKIGDWERNLATNQIDWSPQIFEIFGRDPKLGPPADYEELAMLYDEGSRARLTENVTASIVTGEGREYDLVVLRPSGEKIHVHATSIPSKDKEGKVQGLYGTLQDITARKEVEENLAANEALLREFIRHTPAAIAMLDRNMCYVQTSQQWIEDYHLSSKEIIGKSHYEIFPDVPDRWKEIHQRVLAGAVEHCDEDPFPRADGTTDWLQWEARPWHKAGGEIGGVIFFTQVITDRKRAELSLIESQQRLALATKSARIGIWDWDIVADKLLWDPRMITLYGLREEDFTGTVDSWKRYLHPADLEQVEDALQAALEGVRDLHTEFRVIWPNKEVHYIEAHALVQRGEDGAALRMIGINWDNTERKKLEMQFLRSQRMESIGTLAGGIAHDLNNSLTPIIMSLELLEMNLTDDGSRDLIGTVRASAQRAADMVRQVLSFARGVGGERVEVQVKHLIKEVEKIANDTFLKNILVRTFIARNLWNVIGDPTQLHQVILNLTVNARDAMPEGGTLTLSAQNMQVDERYAAMNPEASVGPYIVIQVEDSGTGMASEVIEKIFDPFFTTKEIGKGTGLGLSTSIAIVKSHGGFIRVYSEAGAGSKFEVYLPARTEASSAAAEALVELPRGNGELILVVDDEASVREVTRQTLEAFGYRVIVAGDGSEALAIYASQSEEIAVVLTDMMMPVMDGPSTIRVLRKMNPGVRIIGASGLASNGHVTRSAGMGVKHFLSKPYAAPALLKAIKETLFPKP